MTLVLQVLREETVRLMWMNVRLNLARMVASVSSALTRNIMVFWPSWAYLSAMSMLPAFNANACLVLQVS